MVAQPKTREKAVQALQRSIIECENRPSRYGVYHGPELDEWLAAQKKRIQIIKACG